MKEKDYKDYMEYSPDGIKVVKLPLTDFKMLKISGGKEIFIAKSRTKKSYLIFVRSEGMADHKIFVSPSIFKDGEIKNGFSEVGSSGIECILAGLFSIRLTEADWAYLGKSVIKIL